MLDHNQLQRLAPSIFATEPWHKLSDNYRFVPTIEVVNELGTQGFVPMYAGQARTRIEGKKDFVRHVIRFRHGELTDAVKGDSIPEIVLLNSHDGSSAYKIMMGMFRVVCGNGMVVASSMLSEIRARHSGRAGVVKEVIDGSFKIIEAAPTVMRQVDDWRHKTLTYDQQKAYATAALELRPEGLEIMAGEALTPRREADRGDDLWHTFNRVQENFIRGGMDGMNAAGIRRSSRAIKSCTQDVKMNRALWRLTEELSKQIA